MADSMATQAPLVHLDPLGTDHHGEAARMRELGPVVRAMLPGDVQMWVVTDYALLADLVTDLRLAQLAHPATRRSSR